MRIKLIVNYGYYVLETLHDVSPHFDNMVRQLVKNYGRERIQLVKA